MSTFQEEAKGLPVFDDSATREIGKSDHPDPTVVEAAPKKNPNESSKPIPAEQGATLGPATDSQIATSEHEFDGEEQPQRSQEYTGGRSGASQSSPDINAEIRALQQRLLQIETQSIRLPRNSRSHKPRAGKKAMKVEEEPIEEDKKLRKLIRKAPYGARWVKNAESRAGETAEDRKDFGKATDYLTDDEGPDKGTMFHVAKDGTMLEGNQIDILYDDADNYANHAQHYNVYIDADERRHVEPHPLRGARPPFALRPIYQQPEIAQRGHPTLPWGARLPPTEWDTSDTDEWSTDTSTRSQDFNYYRARLRGDFEWELDRLNAQVRRYRTHQEKKQGRFLADRAKEENDRMEKEFAQSGSHQYSTQQPDPKQTTPAGKYGMPSLNLVDWYMFKAARRVQPEISFAIDVLIGEPKISDTQQATRKRERGSAVDKRTTSSSTDNPSQTREAESALDASVRDNVEWSGQGPLPERIRINSKPIIDSLLKIHGKGLSAKHEAPTSVVLLRPFKMLNIYAKDIRDLSASLSETPSSEPVMAGLGTATQSIGSSHMAAADPQTTGNTVDVHEARSTKQPTINPPEEGGTIEYLSCLREFLDTYIYKKTEYLDSVRCEKIVFSDLWYLFAPGTLVISSNGKQAYRVASLRSKRHKGTDRWDAYRDFIFKMDKDDERSDVTIKCIFVDFDGRNLGPVVKTFFFNKFDGEKDVTSMDIYPLRFHILKEMNGRLLKSVNNAFAGSHKEELETGIQELQERLIQRGRLFVSTAGVKHMYYSGLTVDNREEIESQVIIDFEEAYSAESRKEWRPAINRLLGTVLDPDSSDLGRGCEAPCCWQENIHDDSYVETDKNLAFMEDIMAEIRDTPHRLPSVTIFPRPLEETKSGVNALTDEELIIMSHSAPGFVLRDRSWAKLDLDNLFEIKHTSAQETETGDDDLDEDSQGAFGQLVLPAGHKKMVLSLISQHFRNKESAESKDEQLDIVRGKGKGLIILLHGAPGVGKTTTAEGVAEVFKKPLFQITCGDLGSSPKEVEVALQTNFQLANKWGCILLLDEADVFLAERRREDFNRNGMVAVFLRVLEYYAGILFLTTNRIGDFDEAFASRIHMSLYYPALDEVSTVKVFRLNLNLIKKRLKDRIKIEEDEIIAAACQHWREQKDARWNGRQIRNACQTALALAEFDAQPKGQKYNIKEKSSTKIYLRLMHLKVVSNAYLEFTEYLKQVHGTDAEGRAKESGLRALDTLIDVLKRDKTQDRDAGGTPSRHDGRSAMNKSPLHGFKLGSASQSLQQPGPSSTTPETLQHNYYPGYYGAQPQAPQPPREAHFAQGHGMQYVQGPQAGSQYLGDPQHVAVPAHLQAPPPGSHLQPPQMYPGGGMQVQGQYQVPQAQAHVHRQQASPPQPGPQRRGYPSATDATSSTGPLTPVSPHYHSGGSQSGQSQQVSGGWTTPDQTGDRGPGERF